jgi:DNA segregation ATPase FtsK/SpoIIIE-like protein
MNEINIEKEKKIDPLKTKMGKTYLKGLQIAVETGSISIVILQRKLEIGYAIGGQILDWMIEQGHVRDDESYLKTTLMAQEEFEELLAKTGISLKSKREKQSVVDDDLYKACLRFAIKKNTVSEGKLQDAFAICKVRARTVIEKMDLDGYIKCHWNNTEILITKEQFEKIYGEQL